MNLSEYFLTILEGHLPRAAARIAGNAAHPGLHGTVKFYGTSCHGLLIATEVFGLPKLQNEGDTGFFAMHIHEYGDCMPPFDKTGMHYNPTDQPHPQHAGDLLPLLSDRGYAWSVFYDDRLTVDEIIGKAVIIHDKRDDFTTQPSGDAGEKIGCGRITRVGR